MSLVQIVIPGLTRNPVFFWIPVFAGMTRFVAVKDAVCRSLIFCLVHWILGY